MVQDCEFIVPNIPECYRLDTSSQNAPPSSVVNELKLKYRRIGTGPKVLLLVNGVGTDFFMWLPVLQCMIGKKKNIFEEITLLAPSYRGLFGCDLITTTANNTDGSSSIGKNKVDITIANCAEDLVKVLEHAKVTKCHAILGWYVFICNGYFMALVY